MNIEFEKICKMTQHKLKEYVKDQLKNTHKTIISKDGFVYAEGTFPVLLVAHLDTVHKELPEPILYDVQKNTAFSPNGIGGDDRCGVYMILKIIKKYNCSVVFCEDEEIGCVGARKFTTNAFAQDLDFNYIIEFDRKGSKDAVFYNCDNDDFEDFITEDFYKKAYGSFSDISVIAPFIGCAAVNLSCGYYSPHSEKEYVVLDEMEKSIEEACKILEKTTKDDVFDYVEARYNNYGGGNYGSYSYYGSNSNNKNGFVYDDPGYDEFDTYGYYVIAYVDKNGKDQWYDTFALSQEEAIGKLLMENPHMCYADIIDICADYLQCT